MEPIITPIVHQSQSNCLRKRHKEMNNDGRKLNDDSKYSESTLSEKAIPEIIAYATEKIAAIGGTVSYKKTMTLFECQQYFHAVGGPIPNEVNKSVYMKPDGGIIIATIHGKQYPLLITEDKVQGTNDTLYVEGKKRQATGNAIERGAKNVRGAEMIFSGMNVFPYLLFASGCDFHHTETISKRIEMMNMGFPNHYLEIRPDPSQEKDESITDIEATATATASTCEIAKIINTIDIRKRFGGKAVFSAFVKAHKWDEMKHGSSRWEKTEIVSICCRVIDLVVEEIVAMK